MAREEITPQLHRFALLSYLTCTAQPDTMPAMRQNNAFSFYFYSHTKRPFVAEGVGLL